MGKVAAQKSITYNVPLIPQCGNQTCWYAAAQMVVRWHRNRRQQSTLEGGAVDTTTATQAACNANQGLQPASVAAFGRRVNLRMTAMSLTRDGMVDLMRLVGPLWYGGDVQGYRGANGGAHAVVITGVMGQNVFINDPWPPNRGSRIVQPFNQFFQQLTARGEVPFLHI